MAKYWLGSLGETDDFGEKYGKVMYDAKTVMGPWANMSEKSFKKVGCGATALGLGLGQKYEKQPDGRWLKVDG